MNRLQEGARTALAGLLVLCLATPPSIVAWPSVALADEASEATDTEAAPDDTETDAPPESQPAPPADDSAGTGTEGDGAQDGDAADDQTPEAPAESDGAAVEEAPETQEEAEPAAEDETDEKTVEQGIEAGDYFISAATSVRRVMDVAGGSTANKANVQLYQSNMTVAQKWRISYDENGYATVTCIGSGKVLDVAGGVSADRRNVQQYQSNGTDAQKWQVRANGDGTYTFVTAIDDERVLDRASGSTANKTNIQLYRDNGTAAQKWTLTPVSANVSAGDTTVADGWYVLASGLDSSMGADIASASTHARANVQLYTLNGTTAQLFKLTQSGGYYTVQATCSGLVLDAASANPLPGTNVQQYTSNGTAAQQWALQDLGNGQFSLINRATGTALEVAGGSAKKGANLELGVADGSAKQRFVLTSQAGFLDGLLSGPVTIASALSSKAVLDVASGSVDSGANAQIYQSNNTQAQKWQVEKVADNTYAFRCLLSGKYLTMDAGGNVCQRTKTDDGSQYWIAGPSGTGYQLTNVLREKVLDVAGGKTANKTNVQGYRANGTKAQSFVFSSTPVLSSGTYGIKLASTTGTALGLTQESTADRVATQTTSWSGGACQKWQFTRNNDDGSYRILNCATEKALDIRGGTMKAGTVVQQYRSNGTEAQKWYVVDNGDGSFSLESAKDRSFVLDLGSRGAGTGATIQKKSGSATQRFTFASVSYKAPGKIGWQNPSSMYQVSRFNCTLPSYASGKFCYVYPSQIKVDATREECVEAFIDCAYVYLKANTPYKWDWALAPGSNSGVDCAGLVNQCMHAVGMQSVYNSYDHYFDPWQDHNAENMRQDAKIKKVSASERKRGDLIFYKGHVAIYLGGDLIINAYRPKVQIQKWNEWTVTGVGRLFN